MLAVRLPEQLDDRLNYLAKKTARPKSYYVRQAIEHFLDDHEANLLALARLEEKGATISIEEMEKRLGMED